jgi:hypothetical protein
VRPRRSHHLALLISCLTLLLAIAPGASADHTGSGPAYPLTERQWEICAHFYAPATGTLTPCTIADIQTQANIDYLNLPPKARQQKVANLMAIYTKESLSNKPKTMTPPPSVVSRYSLNPSPSPPVSGGRSAPRQSSGAGSGGGASPTGRRSSSARRAGAAPGAGAVPQPPTQQPTDANPNNNLVNNDVLNLTNPTCGMQGMTTEQMSRCLRTGDPSVPYPLGNYQMDIHIKLGITHPINNVISIFELIMNVVWLLMLYVLKGALMLVGWAFSLSPFTNAASLGSIQRKLESMYNGLDSAWMNAVLVAIGGYATYLAFVRRRQSDAIGHLLASMAAIVLAAAIIHAPATFIGKPAQFADGFARDAISSANLAAHNQSGTAPASKLASLTEDLFDTFAAGPFCALETNDVGWCLSPPSPLEMKAVQRAVHDDKVYEEQAKAIAADVAAREPVSQQRRAYNAVFDSLTSNVMPSRRADLFLQYPPGSTPRDALYALYSGENPDGDNPIGKIIGDIISGDKSILKDATQGDLLAVVKDQFVQGAKVGWDVLKFGIKAVMTPITDTLSFFGIGGGGDKPKPLAPNKIAIEGSGGVVQRWLVLALSGVALIGVLLILVWLALHLVSQALLGFVLIFAAPIMALAPGFGPEGRRAFGTWGKTLLGAIAAKAFYAAFLGVFVLALTALQAATDVAMGPTVHDSLFATTLGRGATSSGGGWGIPWVMQCLLCWTVFFKRNKIVGFFSIDPAMHQQSGSASMTAVRMMGAAYAAHRLGGAVVGAAKGPINSYRANSLARREGRQTAASELAGEQLQQQELGAAQRSYDYNKENAEAAKTQLGLTDLQLERLKQNPDYKRYTAWKDSQAAHEKVYGAAARANPVPFSGTPQEFARGRAMANRAHELESARENLSHLHARSQRVVDHGDRNVQAHGQLLSPAEVENRLEARRTQLARDARDPDAWKRPENLALAPEAPNPTQLHALERRAAGGDATAQARVNEIKGQVTEQMQSSQRLLRGVPAMRVNGRVRPTSTAVAEQELVKDPATRAELDRRAEVRRQDIHRERYRRRVFRG